MKIWTIQAYEVYQKLLDQGYFYCDSKKSFNLNDDMNFSNAYHWMTREEEIDMYGLADAQYNIIFNLFVSDQLNKNDTQQK